MCEHCGYDDVDCIEEMEIFEQYIRDCLAAQLEKIKERPTEH